MEFEEKVDIDDLVLPSEPMKLAEIEIKQEPVEGNEQISAFESDSKINYIYISFKTVHILFVFLFDNYYFPF